jgi:hypothetical protein
VQAGATGLRQTRAKCGEQNCHCQGRKGDRFDVSFYQCRCGLTTLYNNR